MSAERTALGNAPNRKRVVLPWGAKRLDIGHVTQGVDEFLELIDTPASYSGHAGKYAKVSNDETELEFDTPSGGGSRHLNEAITDDKTYEGITFDGIAGEALSFGKIIYLKSDGKWYLPQADDETETKSWLCMCMTDGASADDPVIILSYGFARLNAWSVTKGLPYYLSTSTPGDYQSTVPSGGEFARIVLYGTEDANIVFFCPENTWIETAA